MMIATKMPMINVAMAGNLRRGSMLVPCCDSVDGVITVERYVRPRTHFGHCRFFVALDLLAF
jgi:hypothetical protein